VCFVWAFSGYFSHPDWRDAFGRNLSTKSPLFVFRGENYRIRGTSTPAALTLRHGISRNTIRLIRRGASNEHNREFARTYRKPVLRSFPSSKKSPRLRSSVSCIIRSPPIHLPVTDSKSALRRRRARSPAARVSEVPNTGGFPCPFCRDNSLRARTTNSSFSSNDVFNFGLGTHRARSTCN
jgi:hypothetical protein